MKRNFTFALLVVGMLAGPVSRTVAEESGESKASPVNTWVKVKSAEVGHRSHGALTYVPHEDRFLLTMGDLRGPNPRGPIKYSEMVFSWKSGQWANHLPDPALYGVWAEKTGYALGKGRCGSGAFKTPYFTFKEISHGKSSYLRPNTFGLNSGRIFYQHAYSKDDKKIYFYSQNRTYTYDVQTRRWKVLSVPTHPAAFAGGKDDLVWGAMCYDPVNREVLLFGGNGVDAKDGHCGTWTFNPKSSTWTKLNLAVEPLPRNVSPLVYDPASKTIVLFGGDHGDYLMSDTWTYDCKTRKWTQKKPSVSPSPRSGHALLYLPKSRKVVLMGGYHYPAPRAYRYYQQKAPFEIWTYDVPKNKWQLIKAFTAPPAPAFTNAGSFTTVAAVDSSDRIVALGYEPGRRKMPATFSLQCDPTRIDTVGTKKHGVPPGTLEKRGGLFTPGFFEKAWATADAPKAEATLKNLPVDTWVKIVSPVKPAMKRTWSTKVYDPYNDVIILWGGGHGASHSNHLPQYYPKFNRWAAGYVGEVDLDCSPGGIAERAPFSFNNRPFIAGHPYHRYAYDHKVRRMIFMRNTHTYLYDPAVMDWTKVIRIPSTMKGGKYDVCLASSDHGVVAWTPKSPRGYGLFLFDKTAMNWKLLEMSGASLQASWCDKSSMVYDRKRDRMIIINFSKAPGKIYAYDFKTKKHVDLGAGNPEGVPFPPKGSLVREAVYMPTQDLVFFQTLVNGKKHLTYDCAANQWKTKSISVKGISLKRITTSSAGFTYDCRRDLIWNVEQYGDVYALRLSGGKGPTRKLPPAPAPRAKSVRKTPDLKPLK